MINKFNKIALVLLSMVLTASVNKQFNDFAFAESHQDKSSVVSSAKYSALLKDSGWKQLQKIWQKLNNVAQSSDYAAKKKLFDQFMKDKVLVESILQELFSKKLLSKVQKDFLSGQFAHRFSLLERRMYLVTCYKVSADGAKVMSASDDLENRYKILQKMAQDGKINNQTFELTRKQILEDIRILNKHNSQDTKISESSENVDLIMLLSK